MQKTRFRFHINGIVILMSIFMFTLVISSCRSQERVTRDDVPYYQPEDFDENPRNIH